MENEQTVELQAPPSVVPAPTVGRIVHYVTGHDHDRAHGMAEGEHRAALVIRTWGEGHMAPNLAVFFDGVNDRCHPHGSNMVQWRTSVPHDPTGKLPFSWHWPERE